MTTEQAMRGPSSQPAVEAWVAFGPGLGNVLFWIVIGAVAGLAVGSA